MSPDEPTLPERRQAEVLARWLDAASTDIPEDLDPDVVEAVLALRPELAPEPSLTVDDILAGVTEGPLAAPVLAPVNELPNVEAPQDPQPEPANSPRWARWAILGAGGLAAVAAAALLSIGVMNSSFEPANVAALDRSMAEEQAAPAPPMAEPTVTADANAELRQKAEEKKENNEVLERTFEVGMPEPDEPVDLLAKDSITDGLLDLPGEGGLGLDGQGLGGGGSVDGLGAGGVGSNGLGTAAGRGGLADGSGFRSSAGELDFARDDEDAVADLGLEDAEAPADKAPFDQADDAFDEFEGAEEEEPAAPVRETAARAQSRSIAQTESVDVLSGAATSGSTREERKAKKASEAQSDLAALERQARPTSTPAAETQAVQNLLAAGQAAEARDSAKRLLGGGGLSNLRRADLYWVLGQSHQRLGDTRSAEKAYREAIKLRGK